MNLKRFFELYRKYFGRIRSQETVDNLESILKKCEEYECTDKEIAYILATAYWETPNRGSFIPGIENLRYTSTARLTQIWPTRFPTSTSGLPYINNPEKLAEKVYGNRKDLGNVYEGDGWKFRGRGYAQITGRAAYKNFGDEYIKDPDLMAYQKDKAAEVLVKGMKKGMFTGKKLSDYKDYYSMRRIINQDLKLHGQRIADYAKKFEEVIKGSK